jgi:hypothetical protein
VAPGFEKIENPRPKSKCSAYTTRDGVRKKLLRFSYVRLFLISVDLHEYILHIPVLYFVNSGGFVR